MGGQLATSSTLQSRISYNVHGNASNYKEGTLFAHLAQLKPSWILMMNNIDAGKRIYQQSLVPNVIIRWWPDDGRHLQMTPQAFVNFVKQQFGGMPLWAYTNNESGFSDELLNWLSEVITLGAGIRLVVGNWSVGTPGDQEWLKPAAQRLLKLADQFRDRVVIGLHEYAGGAATSGLYGGYPDNAGVQPGKPGGLNLIPKANWPPDVTNITRYHVGRFKFILDACKTSNIQVPRMVITEHGFDDLPDIKAWLSTLQKTPPYTQIKGWKTLLNQWRQPNWYGATDIEIAYGDMLNWADKVVYNTAPSPVEAQLIFSWGDSGGWTDMDVSTATTLQNYLVSRPKPVPPNPQPPIPPTYPYPPITDVNWKIEVVSPAGSATLVNVREQPTTTAKVLWQIGVPANINTVEGVKNNTFWINIANGYVQSDGTWYPISTVEGVTPQWKGWVRSDVVMITDVPITPPDPTPIPPIPPVPSTIVMTGNITFVLKTGTTALEVEAIKLALSKIASITVGNMVSSDAVRITIGIADAVPEVVSVTTTAHSSQATSLNIDPNTNAKNVAQG